jgi:hypothetical protein
MPGGAWKLSLRHLLEKKQLSGAELKEVILNEIQTQMALRQQRAAAS